jgi:hypothetical protein
MIFVRFGFVSFATDLFVVSVDVFNDFGSIRSSVICGTLLPTGVVDVVFGIFDILGVVVTDEFVFVDGLTCSLFTVDFVVVVVVVVVVVFFGILSSTTFFGCVESTVDTELFVVGGVRHADFVVSACRSSMSLVNTLVSCWLDVFFFVSADVFDGVRFAVESIDVERFFVDVLDTVVRASADAKSET